ncbi:asparaginase domain-containing protein [Thiomicrorhabdus sp. Milos-T2]|uniref:asparaginase domain-containing protein n=1 Tax=Thiomicrorhabdus sp. Milos-T2 TaxID=90814 RepID=UPI00049419EF|nr:asparaginase domain-containing protein [Thiomicrorhabdus sp. Milos-T2]
MNDLTIELLITGGTLDKDYHAIRGELVFSETHLSELLSEANTTLDIQSQVLMLKDSLEMTDTDREIIYQACLTSHHSHIVITHGTDTMCQTAEYLLNRPGLLNKTIVLTGAMRPFKLGNSDASFNIASALMAVQLAKPSVYIAMNGQLFTAQQVQKNRALGLFETI